MSREPIENGKISPPSHWVDSELLFDVVDGESEDFVDDVDDAVGGADVGLEDVGGDAHPVQGQSLVVGLVVEPKLCGNYTN